MFHKYQHIERLGTTEVSGILDGECYIFPKIDDTNGQVWMEDGQIKVGSRKGEITSEDDNARFAKYILEVNVTDMSREDSVRYCNTLKKVLRNEDT